MTATGLLWFTNDLRLSDNRVVEEAVRGCDRLLCVFVVDPSWTRPNRYGLTSLGSHRARFLRESLTELSECLKAYSQRLLVLEGADPVAQITALVERFRVDTIYRSEPIGVYEQWQCDRLKAQLPGTRLVMRNTHTLFMRNQLPFMLAELPETFSQFRRRVESIEVAPPGDEPTQWPRPPLMSADQLTTFMSLDAGVGGATSPLFRGGVDAGRYRLGRYLERGLAASYKEVRNALDGFDNSSKWSPWLANGCLGAREVLHALRCWQAQHGRCDSSDWLYVELLWREYFQWYALVHGRRLFAFTGINHHKPLTSFYSGRFAAWCAGTTPYPLVNACMRELSQTGYLSNRGRQIVASCLVNELQVDWRYGAAWFEQQLVDYDVAVNWGNWQYLAGVGADPRGPRHFNLQRQAEQFDPDGAYVNRWSSASAAFALDANDAADWPLVSG